MIDCFGTLLEYVYVNAFAVMMFVLVILAVRSEYR